MTKATAKVVLYAKDLSGFEADRFFWLVDEGLVEVDAEVLVSYSGPIVCHDFWDVRDALMDATGDLPASIVDLDEFRISTSGVPEDRRSRDKADISKALIGYGVSEQVCGEYRKMRYRPSRFDIEIGLAVANAMLSMFQDLSDQADANGELDRFFEIEVPVFHLLQRAMSKGIRVDTRHLSEIRSQAEYEFYSCLKHYSAKHDMPIEVPSEFNVKERLERDGFDLEEVSLEYALRYIPHGSDFGVDTEELKNLDAARQVLSMLALSTELVRPIVDVFGSRTSRIQVRSPLLQNMPKRYRSIIVPRDGLSLSYVDYDQFEVGIMAALSGDDELNALYKSGDMYAQFADEHLKLVGNRKGAKQLFLSYAYGMSQKALIDAACSLGASRENAKAAFRKFSQYESWKKSIEAKFEREGRVGTSLGNYFRRTEGGQLSRKECRSAVSQVVQGTASLIFKKAVVAVSKLSDVQLVLPMHDAILFEHAEAGTPAQVVSLFESVMTKHFDGCINGKASVGQFAG